MWKRGRKRRVAKVALLGILAAATAAQVVQAELIERGDLFVHFSGGIAPQALPRTRLAPIAVSVGGTIKTLSGERPPALRQIRIELNRDGHLDTRGLPSCRYGQLVAASPAKALRACGPALVGDGEYRARTAFPEQDVFPSEGRILAFNAGRGGHREILAHVYGNDPPLTRVIVFHVHERSGPFGTVISGDLPTAVNHYGYVVGIWLSLHRRFRYRGRSHSYISAACAAPAGFARALFPFARASMTFADGRTLSSTLTRSCRVSG
jgi:hypothetical protein